MDPDAAAAQPLGVNPCRLTVFLHKSPRGLAVQVPPLETAPVGRHGPKERALPVLPDAGSCHVGQDRPRRIQENLPPLLVPLLGDMQEVLDTIGLKVSHASLVTADTRHPVMKKTLINARSRIP